MEIKLFLALLAIIPYSAFLRFFIYNNRRRKAKYGNIKLFILYLRGKTGSAMCAVR